MRRRNAGAGLLAICMALGLLAPIRGDAASRDPREDASSNMATIGLGKVLTANHKGKFPSTLESVNYQLTAVKGFDNANESTKESGKTLSASQLPMPRESNEEHHQVSVDGINAQVTVGDFRTSEGDSDTQRKRVTPVKISFTKAGYYVYKVTETGSTPANVPGLTYDDHSYFVVVYVANCTDNDGNTVDGVYVHNITSYRNESGSEKYQPNLSDISKVTDNEGVQAGDNTEANLAKVGSSDGEHPNLLEAYRFWNAVNVQDLVLTNNVRGNLGDRSKAFEFRIWLTGLEPNTVYTTDAAAESTGAETSAGTDLSLGEKGTVQDRKIQSDESGNAQVVARLKDDEVLVINGVPVSAQYWIQEEASDHVASFGIESSAESPVIAKMNEANSASHTSLTTAEERVDAEDGTITVNYVNERNLATVTGVPVIAGPMALLLVAAAGLLGARHRKYE